MAMKKSEYGELIEFLTGQFFNIEQKFKKIDERFDRIELRLDRVEDSIHFLHKEVYELRQENTVNAHRSYRMENWIIKASKKINVPYKP